MPRKAAPWFRRSAGRWYVTFQGKQTPLDVTDPKDLAGAFAAFQELLQQSNRVPTTRPEPLAVLVPEYLDSISHRIAPKTLQSYAASLRWLVARFGDSCIAQLDPGTLEKRAIAEGWSDSHRSNVLHTCQAIAKWAGRKDFVLRRPAKESRGAEAAISPELHARVLRETSGDFFQLCRVLWAVGCRPMEAARLTVESVDWATGTATLRSHKTKRRGRVRVLYFNSEALAVLAEQRDKYKGTGALFRGQNGPLTLRAIIGRFLRISEKVGQSVTAYGYRHGFATRALAAGVPDTQVAALMGHSSTAMIHKFYSHVSQQGHLLRDVAEKLAG